MYDTQWLERKAQSSNNECWVILFDGKIIGGARHRSFTTIGNAKKSFAHLVWEQKRCSSEIRQELQDSGRLKFVNLMENEK